MTDFLTRVAQRALGLGPAIQPLVVSRYAPARLPISEARESEPVSQLSAEASRTNERRPHVRSASLISNPGRPRTRQAVIEQNREDKPLRNDVNSLSEHSESIGPTSLGNEIQHPRAFTEFEDAPPNTDAPNHTDTSPFTDANVVTVPATETEAPSLFESNRSTMHQPTRQMESRNTVERAKLSGSSEPQTASPLENSTAYSATAESSVVDEGLVIGEKTVEPRPRVLSGNPALENSTGYSAAEESPIAHEDLVIGENVKPSRRVLSGNPALENSTGYSVAEESPIAHEDLVIGENVKPSQHQVLGGGIRPPADNPPDGVTASPGLHHTERNDPSSATSRHSAQIPETSHQEDRNLRADENEDYTPQSELRSLLAPDRSRREIDSRDSSPEVLTQKPASSLLSPRDERVETRPPVIRVTIGRVEVRAVPPPLPAVEPPPPPAPKLSLDEFLRQHNGRRQ